MLISKSKIMIRAKGHFKSYSEKMKKAGGKYYEDALLRLGDSYFISRDYGNAYKVLRKDI